VRIQSQKIGQAEAEMGAMSEQGQGMSMSYVSASSASWSVIHTVFSSPNRSTPPVMQQQAKQYKAIGEDLWKNRTEKVVRFLLHRWICLDQADLLFRMQSSSHSRTEH
jgi:hypothetical protein